MSFIQILRDSVETINNNYSLSLSNANFIQGVQLSFIFFFETIKLIFLNLISFNWINFFIELPIHIPKFSESIIQEQLFFESSYKLNPIIENYSLNTNKFFIGFFNGFFLSLPISCSNLIFIRRYIIQGKIAGFFCGLGNIFGYFVFISSIIFGWREFIFPFLSIQPFIFVVGLILLINTIYQMTKETGFKKVTINEKSNLLNIFFISFFLIWTEQSCIYQFLGNISFGPEPTIIEGFFSTTQNNFFLVHSFYVIGIIFGTFFFTFLVAFIIENLLEFIQYRLKILRSSFIAGTNFILLSSILGLSFSSIPYYGVDYLLTSPFGFISQDKSFKDSILSQQDIKDSIGMLGYNTINLNTSTYGRRFYLKNPGYESFEELNYAGEYANFVRQGYIPLYDHYKQHTSKFAELLIDQNFDPSAYKEALKRKKENYNKQDFFRYPTFFYVNNKISPSLYLDRRFKANYKKLTNGTFIVLVERSFNRIFFRDDFFISPPTRSKIIKQKFYSNPIYRFLLNTDIDYFLKRELNKTSFSDEKALHKKRLTLTRYNDSLRFYNYLPYAEEFQYLFNGTKSFADRIYNQQFKGTIRIVRRLFSLSFFYKTNNEKNLVLKYDQPLFTDNSIKNYIYHEEINSLDSKNENFLELINQSPFYIGWDEDLKKIILTNRTLSKKEALFENKFSNKNQSIEFTTWPLNKNSITGDSKTLFENYDTIGSKKYDYRPPFYYRDHYMGVAYYKNLPKNINNIFLRGFELFPPTRSGFIWPGNSNLFSFEKIKDD